MKHVAIKMNKSEPRSDFAKLARMVTVAGATVMATAIGRRLGLPSSVADVVLGFAVALAALAAVRALSSIRR
jgi:hypothetical protein